MLLVAFDVLGGRFAVNGGRLSGKPGEVCYFGPDTLTWAPIGGGHEHFVTWAIAGGLDKFYRHLRWPGWEREVGVVSVGEGITVYPFPFTEQGHDLASARRSVVPFSELLVMLDDLAQQVQALSEGTVLRVRTTD